MEKLKHIHILGICGTFMGGIAELAVAKGYCVSGSDENIYPPMSTQLANLGITLTNGYDPVAIQNSNPDLVIIGNALKRGIPSVEYVLNSGIPYQSGPQWLAENILHDRWVIGVSGTHGKTTTSSMVAWILTYAGMDPGFLIGGIPSNFNISAKLGKAPYFVVEADEYDCAFFDKRSKFIHYHPRTCVINNIEFDHADIFNSIEDIKKQFHYLVRTVPGNGALIINQDDANIRQVVEMGLWSELHTFGLNAQWQAILNSADGSHFTVLYKEEPIGIVDWQLMGMHNVHNALAAISASVHAGIMPTIAVEALNHFQSVKRRMEIKGIARGATVYDDFAHHPTAIKSTILGLKAKCQNERVIAVLDIRSNTMCMGTHRSEIASALADADAVYIYQSPKVAWDVTAQLLSLGEKVHIFWDVQNLIDNLDRNIKPHDHILVMSNGGFDNLHQRLLDRLSENKVIENTA